MARDVLILLLFAAIFTVSGIPFGGITRYMLAYLPLTLIPVFFWGRGIYNNCKSDLIAAPTILMTVCVILFKLDESTYLFGRIGVMFLLFGVASIVFRSKATPESYWRRNLFNIGVLTIVFGFLVCIIS